MTALVQEHDCLLLDLDGTVFRGHEATEGAVETLSTVSSRTLYVTNNASRSPAEVAQHLQELGFTAEPDDVVTSAQSAANLLAAQLPPGAAVLIIGTDALAAEVREAGLKPVRQWSDEPVGVVQGHSPQTGWSDLSEAALAIRSGALWVAANVDLTLPSERGLLPGNGSMVAALRAATNQEPQVAGKPHPTLMNDALARGTFSTPLVVGDRLDTDIAGAKAADLPSLHGADRCQHRGGHDPGGGIGAARLPRARSALALCPRRHPSGRTAPRLAHRRRPFRGDRSRHRKGRSETRSRSSAPPPARSGMRASTAGRSRFPRATTPRDRPWSHGPYSPLRIG